MSKGNTFENELLLLIFNNTPIMLIGDGPGILGSGLAGSLYVALHSSDPGEAGSQTSAEATYTGYSRVAVTRDIVGWTVTGNSVSPTSDITFPVAIAGVETLSHFSIGTDNGIGSKLLYYGTLTPNVLIGPGVSPILKNTSTITED